MRPVVKTSNLHRFSGSKADRLSQPSLGPISLRLGHQQGYKGAFVRKYLHLILSSANMFLSTAFSTGLAALVILSSGASAASLQPVTNFGNNPTGLTMNIYVPDRLATKPPVILAVCHFSASMK